MRKTAICRKGTIAGALSVLVLALTAGKAAAGEFQVATCQADRLNFSTQAFADFATRGMRIKRACNPEGPGLRGLVTSNAVTSGRVPRGALALVTINAPAGTRFTRFRWAGTVRRRDCRYSLQLYADAPDVKPISIKNVRANRGCPRASRAQAAGYRSRTFNVSGATRIVQRVICAGGQGRKSCSARGSNFIRTYQAEVGIVDTLAPAVGVAADTALARGEWVQGTQTLNYDTNDNVGVRTAQAVVAGQTGGSQQRPCALASPDGAFANGTPCPNGPGQIEVATNRFPEGTHALVVQAQDTAGNTGNSAEVTARVDNTPPSRVDVGVEEGQEWRNSNDFAVAWVNPMEADRAPISAAEYKLCAATGGGSCIRAEQTGAEIARFGVQVPSPGEWTVSLWRRDAAGNQSEDAASVPVTLRYDPEPPQLGFEPPSAGDPTLVAVQVTDKVSGLADGSIEISPEGSNTWQAIQTQKDGSRLVARIDDATLPAGRYLVRATARDQARNEASTVQRLNGQAMALTLPLRIVSAMKAGVSRDRVVRTVRRRGKRRQVRKRVTELRPAAGVRFGRRVTVSGRLANRDSQGIAGAEIRVLSRSPVSPEELVGVVQTDAEGNYRYTATGSTNRTLRFAYAGSPVVLPSQSEVRLNVPAAGSLSVSRRRVLNGHAVTFTGALRTLPVPPVGKLVELQVRLSGRWQTFRTTRTNPAGRWEIRYRFKRTRGVQRFRFRAGLPREAGYPFGGGASRSVTVRVRGVR